MGSKRIGPEPIMRLTTGHWSLKALAAAVDLGIFNCLQGTPMPVSTLAEALQLPERSLERLLDANAALGFLEKHDRVYENAEIAGVYLVEGFPDYLGDFVRLAGVYGFAKWTRFEDCIKSDTPVEDLDDDFRNSEERMQYFIRAMHNNAKGPARLLSEVASLETRSHLLDLGGGSGVYAIAATERHQRLQATLVDFSPVCKVAREFVQTSVAQDRIAIVEGDLLADELDLSGDVVLLSQVLHNMSAADSMKLIERCYEWTRPGGIVVLHEFVLDDDRAGPLYPALFALNMLITTTGGNAHTGSELAGWLRSGGFEQISVHDTPGPSTFVVGQKP